MVWIFCLFTPFHLILLMCSRRISGSSAIEVDLVALCRLLHFSQLYTFPSKVSVLAKFLRQAGKTTSQKDDDERQLKGKKEKEKESHLPRALVASGAGPS